MPAVYPQLLQYELVNNSRVGTGNLKRRPDLGSIAALRHGCMPNGLFQPRKPGA